MVKCKYCKNEMLDDEVNSCTYDIVQVDSQWYERDTEYFDHNERCHDCFILNKKGNYHHPGCDMEQCPKCGGQLISCDCTKLAMAERKLFI